MFRRIIGEHRRVLTQANYRFRKVDICIKSEHCITIPQVNFPKVYMSFSCTYILCMIVVVQRAFSLGITFHHCKIALLPVLLQIIRGGNTLFLSLAYLIPTFLTGVSAHGAFTNTSLSRFLTSSLTSDLDFISWEKHLLVV